MNLAFCLGDTRKDADRMRAHVRFEWRTFKHASNLAKRRVFVFGSMQMMRFINVETQPGQRMICIVVDAQANISRQSRRTDRSQHSVTKIRKRIEYRGNKHITGNSADCVEMNMHNVTKHWADLPHLCCRL